MFFAGAKRFFDLAHFFQSIKRFRIVGKPDVNFLQAFWREFAIQIAAKLFEIRPRYLSSGSFQNNYALDKKKSELEIFPVRFGLPSP